MMLFWEEGLKEAFTTMGAWERGEPGGGQEPGHGPACEDGHCMRMVTV